MNKNILFKIIEHKKKWLQYQKINQPLNTFLPNIKKSKKNFKSYLKKNSPCYILECKKSSPTLGNINKNFNIKKILKTYNKYADAISIVTEEKFFEGHHKYLLDAYKNTHKPLLCKDFFIDPYQIYYARYHHANAILLMLSVLDNTNYILLSKLAKSLNLTILTEVNNIQELNRAIELKAEIIGINNRNLMDLSIDINNTHKLAPMIPRDTIIISESGINNHKDIKSLRNKVHGFLIGTCLMKSKNIENSIKKILYGKNKICGLTRFEDAEIVHNYGCFYGGLIFYNLSPRNITIDTSINIVNSVPLKYVGIFCNESINKILAIVKLLSLSVVQLHGTEDQSFITTLRFKLPEKTQIWKALFVFSKFPTKKFKYINHYLLDNKNGGTGTAFNWNILNNKNISNIILAGGLNITNVTLALNFNCYGLDFNSGVEISPGIKDKKKIKKIFNILKTYKSRIFL